MHTALTIAGSDSGGGAGIQADLKAFTVLGVFGCSVITAITAQNTSGVLAAEELGVEMVRRQIDAVASDIRIDAVKTGMLASIGMIETVADGLRRHGLRPYVCDPVMIAKSGDPLIHDDAVAALREKLFPLADLITPNRHEAARLAGRKVETLDDARAAARAMQASGAKAVIVKGIAAGDRIVDVFFDGSGFTEYPAPALPAGRSHGSGCTFSAAITASLANGLDLPSAIARAKELIALAIEHAPAVGKGIRPVNALAWLDRRS